ncbi:MAG TPA: flagellar biosynthesis protein FlhB [Steroidobacteraceae bacterium]|nr:flagellar biosynthesis protein FlhB [Steroidobacteraceae bacterium]
MAEDRPSAERTEQPTERRRREAREHGQVARSREFEATAVLLMATVTMMVGAPVIVRTARGLMQFALTAPAGVTGDEALPGLVLRHEALGGLLLALGISAPTLVVAVLAPMAVGGVVFSAQALIPDFTRVDPVAGFGRLFSLRGLVEVLKALGKFVAVGTMAAALLVKIAPHVVTLSRQDVVSGMSHGVWLMLFSLLALAASLGVIAAGDVPFQIWNFLRNMRMTRQEVRDDLKETEGRPEVRNRIRQLQRERARRRMMQEVPTADVVIVNPTHFAVALRYAAGRTRAPRVVAKGTELIAARIREIAQQHGVVIYESPPLARALYFGTDVGEEIPAGLYTAVAKVLAWVYRARTAIHDGKTVPVAPVVTADEIPGSTRP